MFTRFQNYAQKNVGTTPVTLVTCPAGQQFVINQLSCANTTNSLVTCSVTVIRAGVTVFIVSSADLPAGGSLSCAGEDQKIVIMAGDILRVQSSAATSIDVIVSGVLNDFGGVAVVPAPPTSPAATFSITANGVSIGAGGTITYRVTTTNVPNGTVLYWGNIGTAEGTDFTDGLQLGGIVITSNAATFTRTFATTASIGKTMLMTLRFATGPVVNILAAAPVVTVSAPIIELVTNTILPVGSGIQASSAQQLFGSNTIEFTGAGNIDYFSSAVLQSSTQGATIEAWVWVDSSFVTSTADYFASLGATAVTTDLQRYGMMTDSVNRVFRWTNTGGNGSTFSTFAGSSGAWVHMAIWASGAGPKKAFVNGARVLSTSGSTSYDQTSSKQWFNLGGGNFAGGFFRGYIADARVSSGDRYGLNTTYTVPSSRLTVDGTTLVLIR